MAAKRKQFIIEVIDQPFELPSGIRTEKTAVVTHFEHGSERHKAHLGVFENTAIFDTIAKGFPLILDHCFIQNFSLSDYREAYNLDAVESVVIKDFSAVSAFFDSDTQTDFSHALFEGENTTFEKSVFNRGNVNFHKAHFGGNADFSSCAFSTGLVDFRFAEFEQGNSTFIDAHFDCETVSFVNTLFGDGKADFRNVHFGKSEVLFQYSSFGTGDISFDKAIFQGHHIDFRRVEFHDGKVDFRRVQFGDAEVSFEETEFGNGRVSFRSSRFGKGNISFELVNFGQGEVIFERVHFGQGEVSFAKATAAHMLLKGSFIDCHLDLRVAQCVSIDLSDTIVRDIIDLVPVDHTVDIGTINFTGMRNLGRIFIDWHKNKVNDLIANQANTTLAQKAEQFNLLKGDFNDTGRYSYEDYAYIEFKRFELRAKLDAVKDNKISAIWNYPFSGFKWLVFDKMGLYATNPARVFFSMMIVYVIFSMLYLTLPEFIDAGISCSGADNDILSEARIAFYFSAITFLTIGYGDCLPVGNIHWIAPMEGWAGVFMMSYFTVAFVRKILR